MENQFSRNVYAELAQKYRRSDELVEAISEYSAGLLESRLPVLFSPLHLCLSMGVIVTEYDKVIGARQKYYKNFNIKKKRGGYRKISAPKGELLTYQVWIKRYILDTLDFPKHLTSYQKGRSIADNARPHANQPLLVKFDLLNFFAHLTQDKVFGMFKILGYATAIAIDLAKICCRPEMYPEAYGLNIEASLPQGAPTSPAISNFLAGRMDRRLIEYAKKHGFNYTRYADDITFSGPIGSSLRKGMIERIIQDEGFALNRKKTVYVPSSTNQLVTGINVNHMPSIPKKLRRKIHTHLHNCLRFGPYKNLERLGMSDKLNYNDWLLGHINYINILHPYESKKMLEKYNRINWVQ
jgi:RNA-directed DNA polymerase